MSGLCGWIEGDGFRADAVIRIEDMAGGLVRMGGETMRCATAAGAALAVVGPDRLIDLHQDGMLLAAIEGDPRWKSTDYADIAAREGHAAALAAAWRRLGPSLFDVLWGAATVAVLDGQTRGGLVAIDRMGTRPLAYASRAADRLVFASTTDAIRVHPGLRGAVDPQAIYDFMYALCVPAPDTVYKDQKKLLPAQMIVFQDGQSEVRRYWSMPFGQDHPGSLATLAEQFRDRLSAAVNRALTDEPMETTGAFLSGGLDSSTVVGLMARRGPDTAHAFSIGFDEKDYDEMPYARIAARHFKAVHHEYYVTPQDVVNATPDIAGAYDEPFGNSSAVPVYYCAKIARAEGINLMLAGDGGDELLAGNSRYAQQKLFSIYGHLPSWFRRYLLEPAVYGIPLGPQIWPVRKARGYIEKSKIPLPERLEVFGFFNAGVKDRIFLDDVAAVIDEQHAMSIRREAYFRTSSSSELQRMLNLDLQQTLADNDLRKVRGMCELAGVSVRFPFLDEDVAELSAHVPPSLAMKGFKLRWFFKQAFKDFLPSATLTKKKHGFGLPFGAWAQRPGALRDLACDSATRLKSRHILRPDFIDDVIAGEEAGLAAYHCEDLLWSMMMLELWLERHTDGIAVPQKVPA